MTEPISPFRADISSIRTGLDWHGDVGESSYLQALLCDFISTWTGHVWVFLCPPLRKLQIKLPIDFWFVGIFPPKLRVHLIIFVPNVSDIKHFPKPEMETRTWFATNRNKSHHFSTSLPQHTNKEEKWDFHDFFV